MQNEDFSTTDLIVCLCYAIKKKIITSDQSSKKKIEFQLVLWVSSSHILLARGTLLVGLRLEDDLLTWKLAHWLIERQKLLVQDYWALQLCCSVNRHISSAWIELFILWSTGSQADKITWELSIYTEVVGKTVWLQLLSLKLFK